MIREFDLVTLKHAIPDRFLSAGLEGAVVDTMHLAEGFVTVEFFDRDETVAVLPVKLDDLQPVEKEGPKDTNVHETSPSTAPFTYDNGVIYVRSWEWSTMEPTLLGYRVRTRVYPAMELRYRNLSRIPTPLFALDFDNGWTVAVALNIHRVPREDRFDAQLADVFVSPHRHWNDSPDTAQVSDRSDEDILQIIREVAAREPRRVERRTNLRK